MSQTTVSVVIPTYNRGPLIAATLDSALHQTRAPLEVIVVDDGSTDGTPDWIEAHYGARVRLIRQSNGGAARARNFGLAETRGEFIAFLDHDDLWLPQKLSLQLEAMESNARVGVVYSSWVAVDETGQECRRSSNGNANGGGALATVRCIRGRYASSIAVPEKSDCFDERAANTNETTA